MFARRRPMKLHHSALSVEKGRWSTMINVSIPEEAFKALVALKMPEWSPLGKWVKEIREVPKGQIKCTYTMNILHSGQGVTTISDVKFNQASGCSCGCGADCDEHCWFKSEWVHVIEAAERLRQDDEAAGGCGSPYTRHQSPFNRREDVQAVVDSILQKMEALKGK